MGARDEGDGGGVPDRVEWCGDNAVVLAWGATVVVVGPAGETLRSADLLGMTRVGLMARPRYDYSQAAFLLGELDGLRIISSSSSDSLQKVSGQPSRICRDQSCLLLPDADSTLAVFSPGSTHPAAILYDALDHFERKSPKADESIRSIRPELANAVDTCIEAAGRELEVMWQRRLLKVS